jgi:glycerol-3-phosphate acyltransferase PlsY
MEFFMTNWSFVLAFVFSIIAAYLLGSISFSIVITRIFADTDVRKHGSGNAGATNVLRTAGKLPAILTFFLDFLKCVVAILFSFLLSMLFHINGEYSQFLKYTSGIFCMVGHIYPLYFGFKGGRGVTAAAAIMLMLDWRCFLIGISVFIIITFLTRLVSLGSILAGFSIPFLTLFFQYHAKYAVVDTLLVAVISLIIIAKHRENIVRLIHGTEPRMQSIRKS